MTREMLYKKWLIPGVSKEEQEERSEYYKGLKCDFMTDIQALIEKHQAPYVGALDNISSEIENLTKVEVEHAEVRAKRLG